MVSFGFRVLAAELSQYLGKADESISSLSRLLAIVNKIIENDIDKDNESI
jgi:hypothetical protein